MSMTLNQRLQMELDAKVKPAARELTESLRVANLINNDLPKAEQNKLDGMLIDAQNLAEVIVNFADGLVRNGITTEPREH